MTRHFAYNRVLQTQRRHGLTLIELVVVLTILIALAGLLIPMLPSMLTRAHTSTCATNIGEIVRAITTYQQLYAAYPNNWDSLTDGNGKVIDYLAGGAALPASAGGPGTNPGNGEVTAIALTSNETAALSAVGITQLQNMIGSATGAAAGFDPTFSYYAGSTTTIATITKGTTTTNPTLAGLDPTNPAGLARIQALNLPTTGRYVLLGVGPLNSMVGKTIATAPVHFGDQPVLNPEYGYERFVAIFKVSDSAVPGTFTQAQLVGVGPIHDTGLGGIDDHLQGWYQLTTGGS